MNNNFPLDVEEENSKFKLLEAFKRLEFSIEMLKEKSLGFENMIKSINQENLSLREEIVRLRRENEYLKVKNQEALDDIDYAIKVTEDILGKVENEN